jgi:pre-mRNA-splicing factor RBM22/SLT11
MVSSVADLMPEAHAALMRVARVAPHYERNAAKLCSFFAKGECTRGDLCPFRHEMPRDKSDPLAKQNMLDRYHGTNDPLAAKIMGRLDARASAFPPPPVPSDETLKTLWINGIDELTTQEALRAAFEPFGGVGLIRLAPAKKCAFVEMSSRKGAESAVAALHSSLTVGGMQMRVSWARPRADKAGGERPAAGGGIANTAGVWGPGQPLVGQSAPRPYTIPAAMMQAPGGATAAPQAAGSGVASASEAASLSWGAAAAAAVAALDGGAGSATGPMRRTAGGAASRKAAYDASVGVKP